MYITLILMTISLIIFLIGGGYLIYSQKMIYKDKYLPKSLDILFSVVYILSLLSYAFIEAYREIGSRGHILALTTVPVGLFIFELFDKKKKKTQIDLKYIFQHIPKEDLTYEICLEAVKQNGCYLNRVPEKFKDEKICQTALKD